MRLAIDARCLNREHVRGMGKVLYNLLGHFASESGLELHAFSNRPDLPLHLPPQVAANVHCFDCRGDRFRLWEQWALPRRVRQAGIDLLYCPASTVPWRQPIPTVVTLHDAMPWQQNEPGWPRGWYVDRLLPAAYHRCAAIITDSESSRRNLLEIWPRLAANLYVIPLGVSEEFLEARLDGLPESLKEQGLQLPYLLYLGGAIARKRPEWAIRVFIALHDASLRLVMCGIERDRQDALLDSLPSEVRSRIIFPPYTSESDLVQLYAHAAAVLYPTRYEGFGLPVLEAHAIGTPILYSAVGSLAEFHGPASLVLPEDDLDAWTGACRLLISERSEPQPREAARQWARRYSWSVCASRYLALYRQIIASRQHPAVARSPRTTNHSSHPVSSR